MVWEIVFLSCGLIYSGYGSLVGCYEYCRICWDVSYYVEVIKDMVNQIYYGDW